MLFQKKFKVSDVASERLSEAIEAHLNRLQGYFKLLEDRNQKMYSWVSLIGEHEDCTRTASCRRASRNLMKDLWLYTPGSSLVSMFWTWKELKDENEGLDGICGMCLKESRKMHAAARKELWGKLPLYFGLDEWEKLTDG